MKRKLKLSDYELKDLPDWQIEKIKKAIEKRRRKDERNQKKQG